MPACDHGEYYRQVHANGTGTCSSSQCPSGTVALESSRACAPVCAPGEFLPANSTAARSTDGTHCVTSCPLGSAFNSLSRTCEYACSTGSGEVPLLFVEDAPLAGNQSTNRSSSANLTTFSANQTSIGGNQSTLVASNSTSITVNNTIAPSESGIVSVASMQAAAIRGQCLSSCPVGTFMYPDDRACYPIRCSPDDWYHTSQSACVADCPPGTAANPRGRTCDDVCPVESLW